MYLIYKYIRQGMYTYLTKKYIANAAFACKPILQYVKLSVFCNYDIRQYEKEVCKNTFTNY